MRSPLARESNGLDGRRPNRDGGARGRRCQELAYGADQNLDELGLMDSPPDRIPTASAGATYLRTVFRSTPRLRATSEMERPLANGSGPQSRAPR